MNAADDFKLESVTMHQLEMDSKSNTLERKVIMELHQSDPNCTGQDGHSMPGFRFHPTDQELLFYFLIKKRENSNIIFDVIGEVDFNKCEPWDLPAKAEQRDDGSFYLFSRKDKKYPTGSRTNRATDAGYWKATGKDREIKSSERVGMKKTLVFYKGRAPNGEKTNWIMHEYRLEGEPKPDQEDWVVSRVFEKNSSPSKKVPSKFTPESTSDTVYDADYVQYQHPPHHTMIPKYVDSPSTSNFIKPIYTNPGHIPGEPQAYFQGAIFSEHGKIFSRSSSAMKGRRDLYSSSSFEPLASNWDMGSPTRI